MHESTIAVIIQPTDHLNRLGSFDSGGDGISIIVMLIIRFMVTTK
ncbi:hypothetical protein ABID23_000811 [Bartonella silvatica]|uniref:Uncharacterized protein n=1 Tax=Bartonella silvatica TaxID=357760 RepID=A0ABV2HGP3_9HYPH